MQFETILFYAFLGTALLAILSALIGPERRRRSRRSASAYDGLNWATSNPEPLSLGDASDQLRHVMGASFFKKKIMNKGEYRVFRIVEQEIQARRDGCRVLSQTSLGQIIGSENELAFRSVNSKRVDVLIIGRSGDPVAAIEYQGPGHHQGPAAARDAVKREALRKAGVPFIEVTASHSAEEITQLVRKLFVIPEPA